MQLNQTFLTYQNKEDFKSFSASSACLVLNCSRKRLRIMTFLTTLSFFNYKCFLLKEKKEYCSGIWMVISKFA